MRREVEALVGVLDGVVGHHLPLGVDETRGRQEVTQSPRSPGEGQRLGVAADHLAPRLGDDPAAATVQEHQRRDGGHAILAGQAHLQERGRGVRTRWREAEDADGLPRAWAAWAWAWAWSGTGG